MFGGFEECLMCLTVFFSSSSLFLLKNFRLSRIIINLREDSTSSDDTSDSDLDEICLDPLFTPESVDSDYVKCCY